MSFFAKPRGVKIYRGAYEYFKNNNPYSEETFDVFRDPAEMGLHFISQQLSRVSTGELMNTTVDYIVNKEFQPQFVAIQKNLGKDEVKEIYAIDKKNDCLIYQYESKTFRKEEIIPVPPRFHIATPVVCTSILFLKSKKEDPTSKNFYASVTSFNNWNYIEPPSITNLTMERMSLSSENISIAGQSVSALQYNLYQEETDADRNNKKGPQTGPPVIKVFLSKYSGIPYMLKSADGMKVQIKYFNDLEPD